MFLDYVHKKKLPVLLALMGAIMDASAAADA
jgi:hypothetical protein